MKEFIRQLRLWRIRRKITQAIRRIQAAHNIVPEDSVGRPVLNQLEKHLRGIRKAFNP